MDSPWPLIHQWNCDFWALTDDLWSQWKSKTAAISANIFLAASVVANMFFRTLRFPCNAAEERSHPQIPRFAMEYSCSLFKYVEMCFTEESNLTLCPRDSRCDQELQVWSRCSRYVHGAQNDSSNGWVIVNTIWLIRIANVVEQQGLPQDIFNCYKLLTDQWQHTRT